VSEDLRNFFINFFIGQTKIDYLGPLTSALVYSILALWEAVETSFFVVASHGPLVIPISSHLTPLSLFFLQMASM
jgi:hypothetical protein